MRWSNKFCLLNLGGYQFQFLVPGTYHYWSDFVDFYTTTHFSGVVEVLGVESYSAEVNVMLNDIEFTHVKPGIIMLCQFKWYNTN